MIMIIYSQKSLHPNISAGSVFTYFNVDIIDVSINRFDKNWQCFVYPENLSWQFQINVGSVGDNFSIARSEFQTAQKTKIDAFPNPSSGSDFGI